MTHESADRGGVRAANQGMLLPTGWYENDHITILKVIGSDGNKAILVNNCEQFSEQHND
ncbi:hypothetical protein [Tenggerimyces flavus]|uniref:Uncharacterized protein n=1 Tax=Tenggerimyces flavus TaxID=1708749 RepID=A0ABV7Y4M5_9ACTN|nr:hypothetical protein [Tenggerimyces flavus]MBM7790091.1 hypothetical protein [Tenggerimyces flavus]